jgi:ribulose-phosphate 3-epimerase
VNPGFGGQSFIPGTLDKLRAARRIIDESGQAIRLEVDGGVKVDNLAEIASAGADTFVSGSGIFGCGQTDDPNRYDSILRQMRKQLEQADSV